MIYCDLDGVLADFDGTFFRLTGMLPNEMPRPRVWEIVCQTPHFWENMPPMADFGVLVDFLKNYPFVVLTGIYKNDYERSVREKKKWVQKYLGESVPVVCCFSSDKPNYCRSGDVLIDDREENIRCWEKTGGIGILHRNAVQTTDRLRQICQKL